MPFFKALWRLISHVFGGALNAFGKFQTKLIMGLIYFVFVGPIALAAKLTGQDLLKRRIGSESTFWNDRIHANVTLEEAQNPF